MRFHGGNCSKLVSADDKRIKSFLGKEYYDVEQMFGLHTHLDNYGTIQKGKVNLGAEENRHEFDDGLVAIPFAVGDGESTLDVDILCCPVDKRCTNSKKCVANQRRVCEHCEVPLCKDCATVVEQPWGIFGGLYSKPPPRVLSNDLMIFYAPMTIYEDQMTILEMICSSVCVTSMICLRWK